ncbi:hypothetical protein N431DRAFT_95413 [Stipitochalara longipes BDJ]|nr:hypothetical protein N431DRAFT_95413 [Stipitochalara longipes BDJ]
MPKVYRFFCTLMPRRAAAETSDLHSLFVMTAHSSRRSRTSHLRLHLPVSLVHPLLQKAARGKHMTSPPSYIHLAPIGRDAALYVEALYPSPTSPTHQTQRGAKR